MPVSERQPLGWPQKADQVWSIGFAFDREARISEGTSAIRRPNLKSGSGLDVVIITPLTRVCSGHPLAVSGMTVKCIIAQLNLGQNSYASNLA